MANDKKMINSFLSRADWLNTLCLILTLGVPVWSVQEAGWIRPAPFYVFILILSILAGFILAKIRLPFILTFLLALVAGITVVICQGVLISPEPTITGKIIDFINEIQRWWRATVYNAPSPVTIHVTLIFSFLTWLVGYFSTWPLIKRHNPWIGILLGAIVILVNLNFLNSDKYIYFLWFVIASLSLIAITNYTRFRSQLLSRHNAGRGWMLWTASSLCLIIVAVSVAWTNPGFRISSIADYARANDPFKQGSIQLYWQNFFASVPGSGTPSLAHGNQEDLNFTGSLVLSDQVVYIIQTDAQNYWKTQIYDVYDSTGWRTSSVEEKVISQDSPANNLTSTPKLESTYSVIPQVNTRVIPTAGELMYGDIPISEKTLAPMVFQINLFDSSSDYLLPSDIASFAKNLRATRSNTRRSAQPIDSLIPTGLKLMSVDRSGNVLRSISVTRDPPEEYTEVAVSGTQLLVRQQPINIKVTILPVFTPDELTKSGLNYPKTVTDRYLQLPATSAIAHIKELSASITQNTAYPFQKAQAIQDFLAGYAYSLTINAPPSGADGVEYFLFTQKTGYCTYFASAMTVMLRTVGVPARLVVGFPPGEYDAATHSHIIRDRDYHAWTEVYFPGRGWVAFDPTPGSTPPDSSGVIAPPTPEASANPNLPFSTGASGATEGLPPSPSNPPDYHSLAIFLACYAVILLVLILLLIFFIGFGTRYKIYSRLVLLASLAGLEPRSWQTIGEFADQLAAALPQQVENINGIIRMYGQIQYGNEFSESLDDKYRKVWPGLRWALIKRIFHM